MTTPRQRAIALAILTAAAGGTDVPLEMVAKAREAATPTRFDLERIRRAEEKRARKETRKR